MVAAERAAVVAADGKPGVFADEPGGRARAAQKMLREERLVRLTLADHRILEIVVRDERDALLLAHTNFVHSFPPFFFRTVFFECSQSIARPREGCMPETVKSV